MIDIFNYVLVKINPGYYLSRAAGILILLYMLAACKDKKAALTELDGNKLPTDSAVVTGVLDNGLTYIIRHNKNPESRAMLYLVNKIGSVQESEEQRGIAHFVEHMAFRGTVNFPEHKLINFLELAGVKFGADLNAYTSYNETVYQLPIPSDRKGLLDSGLMILKDWAHGVTISEEAVRTERGIILAEMRQRQGLDQRIRTQSLTSMLNGAKYAERSPIGIESVINKVTAADLQKFYKNWYRPDLQAIIAVGDFDVKEMEAQIKKEFGDLKNPENAPKLAEIKIPVREDEYYQTIFDEEISNSTVQILRKYGTKKGVENEGDLYRSMVTTLFNTMVANRINDLRRGSEPPFLSANVAIESLFTELGAASMSITFNPGEYERGFKGLYRELRKIKEFGFDQHELDRAKASFIERQDYQYGERDKVSSQSYMSAYTNAFLKDLAYPSATFYHTFYSKYIKEVSLSDFSACIDRFYVSENKDIYVLAPVIEQQSVPTLADLERWESEVDAEELTKEEEKVSTKKLMESLPKAGKVVKEEPDEEMGVTTWTLANGVKVILKPTTFRNDQVLISASSPGGSALYPDKDYQSAIDAVGLLSHSGVGEMDQKTLVRVLTGKMLKVTPYIVENEEGINASSSKKDLESCLQLIHLHFTQPRLDMEVIPTVLKEAENRSKNRYAKPANVYADSILSIQYNHHFRKGRNNSSRVKDIVPSRSLEIYKERFADASNFTFIFVGSMDLQKVKPLVEQYLGSLPSIHSNEKTTYINYTYATGPFVKTIRKGKADRATVTMVLDGEYQPDDMLTANMTALRDIVRFRMTDRLRSKENQVYTPSVSLSLGNQNKRYDLRIGFVCSPAHVDGLIQAVKEELENLRTRGVSAEELTKFKAEFARGYEVQVKRNDYWLSQIKNYLDKNEPLRNGLLVPNQMKSVTANSFKEYANKYLDTRQVKSFVLMPE